MDNNSTFIMRLFNGKAYRKSLQPLLFMLLVSMGGCKNQEISRTSFNTQEIHHLSESYNFHVVIIDNCHYLLLEVDRNNPHEGFGFFAHRGNCPNPLHYEIGGDPLTRYPPSPKSTLLGLPLTVIKGEDNPIIKRRNIQTDSLQNSN